MEIGQVGCTVIRVRNSSAWGKLIMMEGVTSGSNQNTV